MNYSILTRFPLQHQHLLRPINRIHPFRTTHRHITTPTPPHIDNTVNVITTLADPQALHTLGYFKQIGLGCNYTPVGLIQQSLELIHVYTGIPWWSSIMLVTITLRMGLFPLMVKLQRTSATMFNLRPQTDKINTKMQIAKQNSDKVALYQCSVELSQIYKKNNVNPLRAIAMPLIQAPIMISFFMAIRKIAEAGTLVPSFQHGGALWFTNLSMSDPTYALPVLASLTFLATIQVNAETGVSTPESERFKTIFQLATVAFIPFTATMPAGIFIYWLTSSTWTLGQAIVFQNPAFRKRLNLPVLIKLPPKPTDVAKPLGFMEAFKMAYSAGREANISLTNETNAPKQLSTKK